MAADKETVEQLVNQFGRRLYAYCRKLAPQFADDLYQQTFLRLLSMPGGIDEEGNPAGFLMAVATRLWRDECHKAARRGRIAPVEEDEDALNRAADESLTPEQLEKQEAERAVHRAVEGLSDKLRAPVLLFYMGGLGVRPIARALGIPCGTVKSRLHQARQQLKAELEGLYYE